jgi:hypothetical protein
VYIYYTADSFKKYKTKFNFIFRSDCQKLRMRDHSHANILGNFVKFLRLKILRWSCHENQDNINSVENTYETDFVLKSNLFLKKEIDRNWAQVIIVMQIV